MATWRGVHDLRVDGTAIEFDADAADLDYVLEALAAAGVTGITAAPPSLEELFMRHYGVQDASQDVRQTSQTSQVL